MVLKFCTSIIFHFSFSLSVIFMPSLVFASENLCVRSQREYVKQTCLRKKASYVSNSVVHWRIFSKLVK